MRCSRCQKDNCTIKATWSKSHTGIYCKKCFAVEWSMMSIGDGAKVERVAGPRHDDLSFEWDNERVKAYCKYHGLDPEGVLIAASKEVPAQ